MYSLPKTGLTLTEDSLIKRNSAGDIEACYKLSEITSATVRLEKDMIGVIFIIASIGFSVLCYLFVSALFLRWGGTGLGVIALQLSTLALNKHQIVLKSGEDTVVYDPIDPYTQVPQFVAMINQQRREVAAAAKHSS